MEKIQPCENCPLPQEAFDRFADASQQGIDQVKETALFMMDAVDLLNEKFGATAEELTREAQQENNAFGVFAMTAEAQMQNAIEEANRIECHGSTEEIQCPRMTAAMLGYKEVGQQLRKEFGDLDQG